MSDTPAFTLTPERLAEIKKICACVPFIDNGVGVQETQQAFHDLINALTVPDGHVRLPSGEDVKVLGTLPMTADGCVVGNKAYLWNVVPGSKGRDDDKPMRVCYKQSPIMDPDEYTDGPMEMYSTRAAAESARAGGGE